MNIEVELEEEDEEDNQGYETLDKTPVLVTKGLFIGSFMAERNKDALREAGITHILMAAEGLSPSYPDEFKCLQIHVMDAPWEDLVAYFPKCFAFIEEALSSDQGGVLVHCAAGISRSATIIIGFLMKHQNIGYDAAFRQVHAVRPWVMPNSGFRQQLLEFERLGFDTSKWVAWRHTVPQAPWIL